jgi:hypothetical protein
VLRLLFQLPVPQVPVEQEELVRERHQLLARYSPEVREQRRRSNSKDSSLLLAPRSACRTRDAALIPEVSFDWFHLLV